jgi:hypothetical protein
MRNPLLPFLLLLATGLHAQDSYTLVNRDQIKKEATAKTYRALLKRFEAFDSTLTLGDYRLIYYGSIFQKTFSVPADEKKREINGALQKKDYKGVSDLSDQVLDKAPMSLSGNFYKAIALLHLESDSSAVVRYRDRYSQLVRAVLSSGDGLTCGTGFRVNSVADEYTIIYTWFGVEKFKGQSLIDHCDLLRVQPSDTWQKDEIYFDASEILRMEQELLFGNH